MRYLKRTLLKITHSFKAIIAAASPQLEHKVFVYGTLKRNETNHHWLTNTSNGTAKFLCEAKTCQEYPLIVSTIYYIPFLLRTPGVGHIVKGEVWEVDEDMLQMLDELERHPEFYERQLDTIIPTTSIGGEGSTDLECWVYFKTKIKDCWLSQPMLEEFTASK